MLIGRDFTYSLSTIFPGTTFFCFTPKALKRLYTNNGLNWKDFRADPETLLGGVQTIKTEGGMRHYIMYVNLPMHEANKLDVAETVAHESMHIVQRYESFIETTFDDETEAYLLEFVYKAVIGLYRQIKAKEKKR